MLQTLFNRISTSSTTERLEICKALVDSVRSPDFNRDNVSDVIYCLVRTIDRYHDLKSRHAVDGIFIVLTQKCGLAVLVAFCNVVGKFADSQKVVACQSSGLCVLRWSSTILSQLLLPSSGAAADVSEQELARVVVVQALTLHGVFASERKSVWRAATKTLVKIWKQATGSAARYSQILQSVEPSMYNLCLMSVLTSYLASCKDVACLQPLKIKSAEAYCKTVLASKTKCPEHVVLHCQALVAQWGHEEFADPVLPAVKRALLRSPEIALSTVKKLLSQLSIDLSRYAAELTLPLATQLHCKNDCLWQDAAGAIKSLSAQCSDSDAMKAVVKVLFDVLNGSEGKLSVVGERMSLLTAIGNASHNAVTGSGAVQALAASMADYFVAILKQDVHEGTLVCALDTLGLWSTKFTSEVPSKLSEWFQSGMALKSSTAAVRHAYLRWLNTAYQHTNTLVGCVGHAPLLLKTVEKAASSQPIQLPLIVEAAPAACLLLRLEQADVLPKEANAPLWKVLTDEGKQLFTSDKFLNSGLEQGLKDCVNLSEKLLSDHPERLTDTSMRQYLRVVAHGLVQKSLELRRVSQAATRRLLQGLGSIKLAVPLLQIVSDMVSKLKVSKPIVDEEATSAPGEQKDVAVKDVPVRAYAEAVLTATHMPNADPREAADVVLEALLPANNPSLTSGKGKYSVWSRACQLLKLEPRDVIRANASTVVDKLLGSGGTGPVSAAQAGAIVGVVRAAPDIVLSLLFSRVCELLCAHVDTASKVTVNECAIAQHPDGELYDTSVIDRNAEDDKAHNVKRENKMYSYAEQMAMLELQKEIDAKRRAEGKLSEKLTKKQQDAKDAQLAIEKEIRERVRKVELDVGKACSIVAACVRADATSVQAHVPRLNALLCPLVGYPVTARLVSDAIVNLADSAFKNRLLGMQVAYGTLRQLDVACELPSAWCQEPVTTQAARIVATLHALTVPTSAPEGRHSIAAPLPAYAFAYCFPLLRRVLTSPATFDKDTQQFALAIVHSHAKIRGPPGKDGPELLPRKPMLDLLMTLVASTKGMAGAAATAAVAVCQSASGDAEDVTVARADEVLCLLQALLAPSALVRETSLKCLLALSRVLPRPGDDPSLAAKVQHRLWVAMHDAEKANQQLANKVWDALGSQLSPDLPLLLVEDITADEDTIRQSAARALSAALEGNKGKVSVILKLLMDKYRDKLYRSPIVMDNFGRVKVEEGADQWQARCGVAAAIGGLAPLLSTDTDVEPLFKFFVPDALNDCHEEVAQAMRDAAVAVVKKHGKARVGSLLPILEKFLAEAPASAHYDLVKQSVVVLMGTLATHLDKDDERVKPIVARLIAALSTPSQQVQVAVAECLPLLVPAIKSDVPQIVQKLLHLLLESDKYGERRGAAFGVAALVKGSGILALKQFEIMATLTEAVVDKKNARRREGALLAFEMLVRTLQRLFEPYVVSILPNLLLCFGDGNEHVRAAADDTAKAVMGELSAHGVKLVLPSLLTALEKEQWRTKTGSVELLGAMAHCAPKQLSACLPQIVPKLCEVLTDSHAKVQRAGAQALKQIGGVIKNPEIQAIVPVLLEALQEPSRKATICLQTLLDTQFVHFIDAPSLALIMPVVTRAIDDRSTETRKMATQIIGNMYSLTDQKDLSPYMPSIMPGLKRSLLDPNPEVRTVSAHALGAMVRGIGESSFVEELVKWLMLTLTSDGNTVDRSGAAQGLSDVIGALGLAKLDSIMGDVIKTADRTDLPPHVRDGYIMLYIYLPIVFDRSFLPYVGPILPSILQALADESEFVRETALKAGQRIINMYAETAVELLLPQLERGLFDDNWRIRCSSVQLLGDLLYKLSGVSGKMTTETASEDDNFGTEVSQQVITQSLGVERRNRVLSGLYMGRSDTALLVRQASLHVWKVVVSNTPRTLREILPTLFTLLLGCLASASYDKREVAARTLGDVVRKLGERVLPEILPILEKGLESEEADQRQGVCIGLCEIMKSTSKDHILIFVDSLVPTVRKALVDTLPEVREAAAKTFAALHGSLGSRALDEILPNLLDKLADPHTSEYALDGLKQVMAAKSHAVLPYLVPQLTAAPVNTRALSFLSAVAGAALDKHLGKILPALLAALSASMGTAHQAEELGYCSSVVLSVKSDAGLRTVMDELLKATADKSPSVQAAATSVLHVFCRDTDADYSDYLPQLFRITIGLFTSVETMVLDASWDCLVAITKKLEGPEASQHVASVRQALRYALSEVKPGSELPGLSRPNKGVMPLLPIFREGILNGSPELKEQASIGLAEVIARSSGEALRQSVVQITGPLIRILGDRYSWNVKVALLDTIASLLGKCGQMLKPFLPQLQTTFIKALNDPSRAVRLRSASALGKLVAIHVKVDPLFQELLTGIKTSEDPAFRDTFLQALRDCWPGGGSRLSDAIRKDATSTLVGLLATEEESTRIVAAGCLGMLCSSLPSNELTDVLLNHMLDSSASDWVLLHARSVALSVALKESAASILGNVDERNIVVTLIKSTTSDRVPIILNGYRGLGFLLKYQLTQSLPLNEEAVTAISKGMRNDSNDVKQLIGQVLVMLDKAAGTNALPVQVAKAWIPMLVNGTKEKNTVVKANSEFALVALLRLRQGEANLKVCLAALEAGMKEALNDVACKGLRKVVSLPEPREEDIDDSLLK